MGTTGRASKYGWPIACVKVSRAMTGIKPVVYGYIRVIEPDETEIVRQRNALGKFCSRNDYRLGAIFVDRGVSDEVFARTEFTRLLDAARETGAYGVAVPTLDHLSSDVFVRDALVRMVALTGASMFVVDESNGPQPPDTEERQGSGNVVTIPACRQASTGLAAPDPAEDDDAGSQISQADHELIEQTRKVNKTLSLLVFALQERSTIPTETLAGIDEMLTALAGEIRERVARRTDSEPLIGGTSTLLQIEATPGNSEREQSDQSVARCRRTI